MKDSGLRCGDMPRIYAARLERPIRRTVAACEARPNILVRIHVDFEAVLLAFAKRADCIVDEFLVVDSTGKGSVMYNDIGSRGPQDT